MFQRCGGYEDKGQSNKGNLFQGENQQTYRSSLLVLLPITKWQYLLLFCFSLKTKKPTKKRKKSKNEVKHVAENKSLSLICNSIDVKVSNESFKGKNVLFQPFYGICCILLQESKRGKALTKTVSVRSIRYCSTTQWMWCCIIFKIWLNKR